MFTITPVMKKIRTITLTFLMSLFSILLWIFSPNEGRALCCVGMLFSTVGDLILMDTDGLEKWKKLPWFYIGGGAFAVTNLLYFLGYFQLIQKENLPFFSFGFSIALSVYVLFLLLLLLLFRRAGTPAVQCGLILAYDFMISLASFAIYSYAFSKGGWYLLAAFGSLSFFLSDLLIILRIVLGRTRLDPLVWVLYPIGQVLILFFA